VEVPQAVALGLQLEDLEGPMVVAAAEAAVVMDRLALQVQVVVAQQV
jgi:hypothetical protein